GWAWAIFVLAVAAAEAAVGLALIISVYRRRDATVAEDLDLLQH
ncbi:MAG TPA: NADH-quinone oxidoreductase subunit NuoK, partial [Chloroflexi bacterium]|nr:NADH-quinone oxidoreductase subunit NuoK [Chloroflexota bacterium]